MRFRENFEKIETALYTISVMKNALFRNYSELVDGVLAGEISDEETIREIVYGILELMGEERFADLDQKLQGYLKEKYSEILRWRCL